jgi:hypothetical protein
MEMVIEYPELLPDALQQTRADFEQEARMALVMTTRKEEMRERLSFISPFPVVTTGSKT